MKTQNELLTELIDASSEYDRLCREIHAKEIDLKEYETHMQALKARRDIMAEKITKLHKELGDLSQN